MGGSERNTCCGIRGAMAWLAFRSREQQRIEARSAVEVVFILRALEIVYHCIGQRRGDGFVGRLEQALRQDQLTEGGAGQEERPKGGELDRDDVRGDEAGDKDGSDGGEDAAMTHGERQV